MRGSVHWHMDRSSVTAALRAIRCYAVSRLQRILRSGIFEICIYSLERIPDVTAIADGIRGGVLSCDFTRRSAWGGGHSGTPIDQAAQFTATRLRIPCFPRTSATARRNSRLARFALAAANNRPRLNEAHLVCGSGLEKHQVRDSIPADLVRGTTTQLIRHGRLRHGSWRHRVHVVGSRFQIRATGSIPSFHAKALLEVFDLPTGFAPTRPRCRRRSTICPCSV